MLTYTREFWAAVERKLDVRVKKCDNCYAAANPKLGIYIRLCYTGPLDGEARPRDTVWGCTQCYPPRREIHYNPRLAAKMTGDLFPPAGKG